MAVPAITTPEKGKAKLSGLQKAAILMVILGEKKSAEVLRELDETEVDRIGRAIASAPTITSELTESILTEFYQMILTQDYVLKGGIEYAQKILVGAFGAESGRRLIERVTRGISHDSAGFDALQKADPQQLANFIHNEHPQTIALILSHLGPTQAASLLSSLPAEKRSDVSVRVAKLSEISPDIIARISKIIGTKLLSLGEMNREAYGGVRSVAEMFNRLDPAASKEIIASIEVNDQPLGLEIRQLMFVFEDLSKIDARGIREILERVDRKILTVALKGTSETLKNTFLQVMSQRGADMLREDMEAMGPVRMRDVEQAQQEIIETVRALETEGVISLSDSDGEQYVS